MITKLVTCTSAMLVFTAWALSDTPQPQTRTQLPATYLQIPLTFEPNVGQADNTVKYLARGSGYAFLLTDKEAVLKLHSSKMASTVRLSFASAAQAKITAESPLETRMNYLLGARSDWKTDVPTFGKIRYAGLYRGVDVVFYGRQRQIEYDFVVAPGADPRQIAVEIGGAKRLKIADNGDLVIATEGGDLRQHKPFVYQMVDGRQKNVAGEYVLLGKDRIGFKLGVYDHSRELVIDPVLTYSTYFGGTGADEGTAIAVNSLGQAFVAGNTRSADLRTTSGAYDRTCGSDGTCDDAGDGPQSDAFVAKLNAAGSGLIYATYLGGNSFDRAAGIAVDGSGNAVVVGGTNSTDFPGTVLGPGAPSEFNSMAFAVKLNASGSGLLWARKFGGSGGSDSGSSATAVKLDAHGNAYLAGTTSSTDFPVTSNAFQSGFGGAPAGTGGDAFVLKLNSSGAISYASYLGGNMRDVAYDLAIDPNLNAYVTGYTSSANFPTTSNAFQRTLPSNPPAPFEGTSAFVAKVSPTGSTLVYSTYLGGTSFVDVAHGIAVNSGGYAYVTGIAQSSNFPTTSGAFDRTLSGIADAFVTKLTPTGSGLVFSTFLGGSADDRGTGIAVDGNGFATIVGTTYSGDFPTNNYGFQRVRTAGDSAADAFAVKLTSGGALSYGSFLGGSSWENDQGFARVALNGSHAFVTGTTNSTDFPTTPGALQTAKNGPNQDAFVARISPLCGLSTVNPSVTICSPSGSTAAQPLRVVAGSWSTRPVRVMQVYINGRKVYEALQSAIDVRLLAMQPGTYRLTVQAIDTANNTFKKTVYVTLQ